MEAVGLHFDDAERNPYRILAELDYHFRDLKTGLPITIEAMLDRLPRNDLAMKASMGFLPQPELVLAGTDGRTISPKAQCSRGSVSAFSSVGDGAPAAIQSRKSFTCAAVNGSPSCSGGIRSSRLVAVTRLMMALWSGSPR